MDLWGRILGRKGQFDLSSVTQEDIRADEIALEKQEEQLDAEIEQYQRRIVVITDETIAAREKSRIRRATRKIIELQERITDKEHALDGISRSLIALGRLRRLVEGTGMLIQSGVLQKLQALSPADATRLLCGEMARAEIASKGLDAVIEVLSGSTAGWAPVPVSEEAQQLMAAFEAAIEAGDPTLVTSLVAQGIDAGRREVLTEA